MSPSKGEADITTPHLYGRLYLGEPSQQGKGRRRWIGPGWGNGKATAVTFAREGAAVFCVDRNGSAAEETVGIIKGEGGEAAAFTADATLYFLAWPSA